MCFCIPSDNGPQFDRLLKSAVVHLFSPLAVVFIFPYPVPSIPTSSSFDNSLKCGSEWPPYTGPPSRVNIRIVPPCLAAPDNCCCQVSEDQNIPPLVLNEPHPRLFPLPTRFKKCCRT
jgi:hypothetical protein